ncbi:MAG TPA: SDR family oxidoreductase [Candidatus Angelobacter sp.]|nr:SDR family oxidoreductase [Candidatus Angelobacter sp.]
MRILIFGATGGTGRYLVSQGLEQELQVTAFTRNPGTLTTKHPNLTIVKGDLSDQPSITNALNGVNAVISVLGNNTGKTLFTPNNIISQSLPGIISAMQQCRVERLLFVTSFGINTRMFWPEKLLLRTLLKNLFTDLPVQEQLIQQSGLNWTIVRPARLTNGPKTGECRSGEDIYINLFTSISRADVAAFLLKEAVSSEYQRKVVTVSH